jgi:hypothetical protein
MSFFSQSDYNVLMMLVVLCLIPIPCLAIGIWGWQRNVPPHVKRTVKNVAKIAAKAAIDGQIRRMGR